jgi:hypothetical protein
MRIELASRPVNETPVTRLSSLAGLEPHLAKPLNIVSTVKEVVVTAAKDVLHKAATLIGIKPLPPGAVSITRTAPVAAARAVVCTEVNT